MTKGNSSSVGMPKHSGFVPGDGGVGVEILIVEVAVRYNDRKRLSNFNKDINEEFSIVMYRIDVWL